MELFSLTFRIAALHSKDVIPEEVADAAVAAFFLDLKGLLKRMKAGRRGELLGGGGDDGRGGGEGYSVRKGSCN